MAYSDSRNIFRFDPASIAGAAAINGTIIAGLLMLGADILPLQKIIPIELINPATPPPSEPPPVAERTTEPPKPGQPTAAPPLQPTPMETTNDFVLPPPTGETFGSGTAIQEPPVTIVQPVFKAARYNPRFNDVLQPSYPPGMVRNQIEGKVTVKVLIGADGRVKQVQAVRADEEQFLETTRRQALNRWRFIPATRDGVAVESWKEMTVSFVLPD